MKQLFNNVPDEFTAWYYAIIFMLIGFSFAFFLLIIFVDPQKKYRQGQIDAIRGIIKWELKKNKDGEEVWTRKDDQV